ncbi:MAG: fimbria/pilus outer membrane usher protein, partial [Polyangiales bacterium]
TPIGQVELELAASRAPGQASGAASFLSYSFISRLFGAGVFGRLMTNRYATLDVGPTLDRAIAEVGVFGSVPVSRRLSISTQDSLDRYRDRGTTARGGVQAALRVAPLWTTLVSFSQARNEDGTKPWEVYAAVTCAMAGGHNASVAARSVEQTGSLLMAANKSVPIGEGYGYRASATISEQSRADALVQYQTLFGRYGAEYSLESGHSHAALDAAGALVAVPGAGVFPTLPVQDGFGVIRVPGVRGVRGYVNNQEIGSTDRYGNLLVPNLLSYYGNRLSIAQEDVPLQYEMQVTEMTLAPAYRGAAIATFPIVKPHYYRGRVTIDDHGTKVVPKYGQLRITRGEQELATPLGEQGEFEVDGVAPGRRVLAIDYADGTCPLELEIPDSDQVVIELGELVCKVH